MKWILFGLGGVIVVFLIVVAMQPSDFKVERSATLRAPAPAAFAQVNDLQAWQAWSPWENVDPALKRSYEGPRAGRASWCASSSSSSSRSPRSTTPCSASSLQAKRLR